MKNLTPQPCLWHPATVLCAHLQQRRVAPHRLAKGSPERGESPVLAESNPYAGVVAQVVKAVAG